MHGPGLILSSRIGHHPPMLDMAPPPDRARVIEWLAVHIVASKRGRRSRIGIDGPDGAGKTSLADELASLLRLRGEEVVRASIDGFHRPSAERRARGRLSPEGYYNDAFDFSAFRSELLDAFGEHGNGQYRTEIFDYARDIGTSTEHATAGHGAVLIVDGVFLARPEVAECWDVRVYVDVPAHVSLARGVERDLGHGGERAEIEDRYRGRYLPAQAIYSNERRPIQSAAVVLLNEAVARPLIACRVPSRTSAQTR